MQEKWTNKKKNDFVSGVLRRLVIKYFVLAFFFSFSNQTIGRHNLLSYKSVFYAFLSFYSCSDNFIVFDDDDFEWTKKRTLNLFDASDEATKNEYTKQSNKLRINLLILANLIKIMKKKK